MSRRENFRVVISPRRPGDLGAASVPDRWVVSSLAGLERHYVEECERLAAEARRHVSEHAGVTVEWDTLPDEDDEDDA